MKRGWDQILDWRYLVSGGVGGYLISALLFIDSRLPLWGWDFARLSVYFGLFYGAVCFLAGVVAFPLWEKGVRRFLPAWELKEGRRGVVAAMLFFLVIFFWNFDSFYHHSTFEFWLLVRRLLTESFVPTTIEGAINLGLLVLLSGAACAFGFLLAYCSRLAGAARWHRVSLAALATAVLLPWFVEAGRNMAETPGPPLLARPGRKILVVGVDALDWKVASQLMASGDLPNLRALAESGVAAPLRTLVPAYSPMVWTTIATGRLPADHNIRHFNAYSLGGVAAVQPLVEPSLLLGNPYLLRVLAQLGLVQQGSVTGNCRRVPAFWELTSQAQLSTVVLGWWATAPVEALNGIMVSDYATHTDLSAAALGPHVFPPAAIGMVSSQLQAARNPPQEWLDQLFNLSLEAKTKLRDEGLDAQPAALREITHSLHHDSGLVAIAKDLLRAGQPEVLAVYLEGLDTVGHLALHFWLSADPSTLDPAEVATYQQTAKAYYQRVDQWIGELVSLAGSETSFIVVSDHGFAMEEAPNYFHHKTGPDGVIFLSGPMVRPSNLAHAHVLDIAPTLLYLLGMPRAMEMGGRVLTETLKPDFLERFPAETVSSYAAYRPGLHQGGGVTETSAQTSGAMIDRLKTLGYIE